MDVVRESMKVAGTRERVQRMRGMEEDGSPWDIFKALFGIELGTKPPKELTLMPLTQ